MIKLYEGNGIYSIKLTSGKEIELTEDEFLEIARGEPSIEKEMDTMENSINGLKYSNNELIKKSEHLEIKVKNLEKKNKLFEKEIQEYEHRKLYDEASGD